MCNTTWLDHEDSKMIDMEVIFVFMAEEKRGETVTFLQIIQFFMLQQYVNFAPVKILF